MILVATIEQKLRDAFSPVQLIIKDESHLHAGHNAAAKKGETHFRITIVSSAFEGVSRVKRHQLVYKVLQQEMEGPIHALALKALTPQEFQVGNNL